MNRLAPPKADNRRCDRRAQCSGTPSTFCRRRQQRDAEQVDTDRRRREQEVEVDRLQRLVAELLMDKQMLQDRSRKTTARRPNTASSCFRLASAIAEMVRRSA
jgi:hypothetical protein